MLPVFIYSIFYSVRNYFSYCVNVAFSCGYHRVEFKWALFHLQMVWLENTWYTVLCFPFKALCRTNNCSHSYYFGFCFFFSPSVLWGSQSLLLGFISQLTCFSFCKDPFLTCFSQTLATNMFSRFVISLHWSFPQVCSLFCCCVPTEVALLACVSIFLVTLWMSDALTTLVDSVTGRQCGKIPLVLPHDRKPLSMKLNRTVFMLTVGVFESELLAGCSRHCHIIPLFAFQRCIHLKLDLFFPFCCEHTVVIHCLMRLKDWGQQLLAEHSEQYEVSRTNQLTSACRLMKQFISVWDVLLSWSVPCKDGIFFF